MKDKREYIYSVRIFKDIEFFTREDDWDFKFAEECYLNSMYAGWFNSKEDAFNGVMDSRGINEHYFDYALVETVGPTTFHRSSRWLFKFNYESREYEEIEITGKLKQPFNYWTIM